MDSSGFGKIAEAEIQLIGILLLLCVVFVPLGIWKMVDLIILLCHHVQVIVH